VLHFSRPQDTPWQGGQARELVILEIDSASKASVRTRNLANPEIAL
jgi:hypothetical protein